MSCNNKSSEKNSEIRSICRTKTVFSVLLLIGILLLAACAKQPESGTDTKPLVTTGQSDPTTEETSAPHQPTEEESTETAEDLPKPDATEPSPTQAPGPEEIELPKDNF